MLDLWRGGGNVLKRSQRSHLAISHVCPTHTPPAKGRRRGQCLPQCRRARQTVSSELEKLGGGEFVRLTRKLQMGAGETKQEQHDTNPPKDAASLLSIITSYCL